MRWVNPFSLRNVIAIVALVLGLSGTHLRAAEGYELVMVEQAGCHWCARWNAEIAPIYPKTDEGGTAPLRRVDLHKPFPDDLEFDGRVVFTPTFILTRDGQEQSRIEGYSGDELFWWMLTTLFEKEGL